jgi:O-antigen ligase/polysaccharide polymerase Wzy-like membrane protein
VIAAAEHETARVTAGRRNWARSVILVGAVAAVGLGLLAGTLAAADRIGALVGLVAIVLPVVIWRRPAVGIFGLGCAGLVIEQYRIGAPSGDITDHVPWFTSLSDGFKLSGVYINPAELGIITVLAIVVARSAITRRFSWPTGFVGAGYAAVLVAVVVGVVHGGAAGGNSTPLLWEIRPFLYVFLLYFLALQLNPTFSVLQALYWCLVVGTGFKALQGLAVLVPVLLQRGPRPDFLLSHDDAFFFGVDIILVASLWLFGQKGRLRTVATMLVPLVIIINMANSRRTAWLILAASLLVTCLMVVVRLPAKRSLVAKLVIATGAVSAVYLPLYWNSTGGILGQPARAISSAVAPSQRDQTSDLYRVAEDANLARDIKRSFPFGVGFGVAIDYAIPIVDLSGTDPMIKYIPHNGILYVWMRMGLLGIIAWLSWIGAVIISAAQLLRARDLRLACFASFAAACVVGYVIEGYYDLGLVWFRMAFFMGLVIGLMQVAHRIDGAAHPIRPSDGERLSPRADGGDLSRSSRPSLARIAGR